MPDGDPSVGVVALHFRRPLSAHSVRPDATGCQRLSKTILRARLVAAPALRRFHLSEEGRCVPLPCSSMHLVTHFGVGHRPRMRRVYVKEKSRKRCVFAGLCVARRQRNFCQKWLHIDYMHLVTQRRTAIGQSFPSACRRFSAFLDSSPDDVCMNILVHSPSGARTAQRERVLGLVRHMATTIAQKALGLLSAFERAGREVSRVSIEGKRIELVLSKPAEQDEFERIDMRHDKT